MTTTLKLWFSTIKTTFTNIRALIVFALLYALLLVSAYFFIATREATVWQVVVTYALLILLPAEFFIFQASILSHAREGKFHWRAILVNTCKCFVVTIPVLLLGALIDDLRRTERTTRDLAASLVRAQDEERRRIARDLHDSTGQNLIAATLIAGRLEKVLPESAQSSFHELEDMLQQSIREVRTVSYLLHPPLLDEAGLGPALRHFVEGFMERSEIVVDLEVSPDLKRLPADTELALFRVVQEALTNISRHSDSATAVIRLAREGTRHDEKAVLMIADAGKGMPDVGGTRRPAGGPNTGVGLASMRERLHQLGGRLDIASTVGRTVITATVPLQT